MTAPIVFTAAGELLTHGPLTPLGITPSKEVVKVLAEVTLVLVLLSDASRVVCVPRCLSRALTSRVAIPAV
jgi:sodium/hydrogen antiporter